MQKRAIGICLGAATIKYVELLAGPGGLQPARSAVRRHESDPRRALTGVIESLAIQESDHCMLTGRSFCGLLKAPALTEPEAVEHGLAFLRGLQPELPDFGALASMGAENFVVYLLDRRGHVKAVESGNKCASGTGEFFLQQIGRLNLGVEQALALAEGCEQYKVAGRCSVFCKSDCTHALNKGIPAGRVTAGLCQMMAEKIYELLKNADGRPVAALGGVSRNRLIMRLLAQKIPNLSIPPFAELFEALGAAAYAAANATAWGRHSGGLFHHKASSFRLLPPIRLDHPHVSFTAAPCGRARPGDECVVGLDVGSTTTKAVVLRLADAAVLSSVYLRTNGNPIAASRQCYARLAAGLQGAVAIVGLGTTGSGRQIAGLHAGSEAIVNEIIAHATAAAHFDPTVDTIFEIGGQDAKYTHLLNGVPADYAMNEACSAGTGSFLEEAAAESFGLDYGQIEAVALAGSKPLNFNDQCAAFIGSDIKTAIHEGISREDIVAGLVYSICLNYINRVKGQRPVGQTVFMQGGVCYNRAVPLAMAELLGRRIVVPPDPGLMGAFGVALEVRERLGRGGLKPKRFDLQRLSQTAIDYASPFVCAGHKQGCDRGCEINVLILGGRKYPFGGACNRYYNRLQHVSHDAAAFDFVRLRQKLVFEKYAAPPAGAVRNGPRVGVIRSYLTNQLFPLYSHFFQGIGCRVELSDAIDEEGLKYRRAALCFPGEIAHGAFHNLLAKRPDAIFMPIVLELNVDRSRTDIRREHQSTCLLLQSEPYYLKSAFKSLLAGQRLLSPSLDFARGYEGMAETFVALGRELGASRSQALAAFSTAVCFQRAFERELRQTGQRLLQGLESGSLARAVVLFGRPYNAFAREANLGIPAKFASAGITIIPWDMLPFEQEQPAEQMNWAIGQGLMKAVRFVSRHRQLFGVYITNFSCGPDSFLLSYARDLMGDKPLLTLELDGHTADAGVNTRIEAFLEIIARREAPGPRPAREAAFVPASVEIGRELFFIDSHRRRIPLFDSRVRLVIPSMGGLSTQLFAAALRGYGVAADILPPYSFSDLKVSRPHCSCKECLPLLLVTGGILRYLESRRAGDENIVFFMPSSPGNCRFTQYAVFLRNLITKKKLENVALLSLNNETGYAGFSLRMTLALLSTIVIADVMEDIKNALYVLACDRQQALESFETEFAKIVACFSQGGGKSLKAVLNRVSRNLARIPLRYGLDEARIVGLQGEIFVRRDAFACQDLLERLARRDIIVKRAHILEWLDFCDYNVKNGVFEPRFSMGQKAQFWAKQLVMRRIERQVKSILAQSGLYEFELVEMDEIISLGNRFFDRRFTSETTVVVGSFFRDIISRYHGMISIGPFACMATRVAEAVLSAESSMDTLRSLQSAGGLKTQRRLKLDVDTLPFLAIESDGNPFPQIIAARIDAFCLQVERLYEKMHPAAGQRIAG